MGALRRRLVLGGRERDGIVGERLLTYSGAGYLGHASTARRLWSSWPSPVRSPSFTIRTLIVRDELVDVLDDEQDLPSGQIRFHAVVDAATKGGMPRRRARG